MNQSFYVKPKFHMPYEGGDPFQQRTKQAKRKTDVSDAAFNELNERSSIQESNSFNDRASDIVVSLHQKTDEKSNEYGKSQNKSNVTKLNRPSIPESYQPPLEVLRVDMQTSTRENQIESARRSNKSLQVLIPTEESVIELPLKVEEQPKPNDSFQNQMEYLMQDFMQNVRREETKGTKIELLQFEKYLQERLFVSVNTNEERQLKDRLIQSALREGTPKISLAGTPVINKDSLASLIHEDSISQYSASNMSPLPQKGKQPSPNDFVKQPTIKELNEQATKIQAAFRGHVARTEAKVASTAIEQKILDTFVLHYFDSKAQQKLYFKIKMIWLIKKNLIKVVIMDEIAKKSNSIIEKMPPQLLHRNIDATHMAKEIKGMISIVRLQKAGGSTLYNYTVNLNTATNFSSNKVWMNEVVDVQNEDNALSTDGSPVPRIKMVEFKQQSQAKQREQTEQSPLPQKGRQQSSSPLPKEKESTPHFDHKDRMKFLKQSTLMRKQTYVQPRQPRPQIAKVNRAPVFKVQKKSHQLNSHRKGAGHDNVEDHHLDFVMKKELDPERAALIIQTYFRSWSFKMMQNRMRMERKQREKELKLKRKEKKRKDKSPEVIKKDVQKKKAKRDKSAEGETILYQ